MIINHHTLLYDDIPRTFKNHVFFTALHVYLEKGDFVIIVCEKTSSLFTVICRHGIVNVSYDALCHFHL